MDFRIKKYLLSKKYNNEFIIILLKNNRPEVIISLDKSGSLLEALGRCNCEISDDLRNQIILSLIPLVK